MWSLLLLSAGTVWVATAVEVIVVFESGFEALPLLLPLLVPVGLETLPLLALIAEFVLETPLLLPLVPVTSVTLVVLTTSEQTLEHEVIVTKLVES